MSEILDGMSAWIADVIYAFGYAGVAFLVFLENIFPPMPSEIILPLTGFLVSEGRFDFFPVLFAATTGSVLSAIIWWTIGHLFGKERVYRMVDRYGKWFFLRSSDVKKAERFFEKHGGKAVFFGRFVPGVRSLVSVPAGLAGMPLFTFAAYTTLGSVLWNALLVGSGILLHERWRDILQYMDAFEYIVYATVAALVAWFVLARVWPRESEKGGRP